MIRGRHVPALAAIVTLMAPAVAAAHISLHPNTIPAGAFPTVNVRVPGEETGAHATKVDMLFPPGFTSVNTANVPGWSVNVVTRKLAVPIKSDTGTITDEVAQIIWTWKGPLGRVDNNQFVDFPLQLAMPDNGAGQSLTFKTVENYSNGKVARWIGPTSASMPAPTVNVTAKGGVIEDVAGAEAGPAPGQVPVAASGAPAAPTPAAAKVVKSSSGASKGLGIAALILGALGLLAGLGALATRRRATVAS